MKGRRGGRDAHRAALIPLLLPRGGDPHRVYAHSAHTPLSWAVVIRAYDCARALMEAGWASIAGSSRYASDGTRLPRPSGTEREIVADALDMAGRARGHRAKAPEARAGPRVRGLLGRHRAAVRRTSRAQPRGVALLLAAGADPTLRDPVLGCTLRARELGVSRAVAAAPCTRRRARGAWRRCRRW